MGETFIKKHISLTQLTVDILDELIKGNVAVTNYSEAIRYAILSLNTEGKNQNADSKLNAMSKDIAILIEMTAGGFNKAEVDAIGKAEETFIYMDAKKNVESTIQKSVTNKSNEKGSVNKDKQNEQMKKSRFTI